MADRYIDIFEVSEYGDFFLDEVKRLVGASPLVNVEALSKIVQEAKEKVEEERKRAGVTRKSSGPEALAAVTEALRGHLSRFYSFLNSLDPKEVAVDVEKFFPGNVLDGMPQLKPADLKARSEKISEGFALEVYKDKAELLPWKKKLEVAQQELAQAMSNRGGDRNESILLTASMSAARDGFLKTYNGVAKPLVRGLLNGLQRGEEYGLYFRDLQVNEDPRTSKPVIVSTPENKAPENPATSQDPKNPEVESK